MGVARGEPDMRAAMLFTALVACGLASAPAWAQIKAEHPRNCVMSVGPTQMMFSAFQENKTDEIFCQHIPTTGETMLIIDARQPELRDMTIEVRVLRNVGQKDWRDDLDVNTVAVLPPGKYLQKKGSLSFNHAFGEEGEYIAVVRAMSDDGLKEYVGQYIFTIGDTVEWLAVGGAGAAALAFICFGIWGRDKVGGKPANKGVRKAAGSSAQPPSSGPDAVDDVANGVDAHGQAFYAPPEAAREKDPFGL